MRLGASGRQFPNREAAVEFFRQVGDRIASRAWREGARRRLGAAVHVVCRLGLDQRRGVHAAARAGTAGRSTRRHARLFPDDGDSSAQGPVLLRLRHAAERAAGGHRRREVRAAFLAQTRIRSASTSGEIPSRPMTIVGVVGTVKQYGLDIDGRIVVLPPVAGTAAIPGRADVVGSGGCRRRHRARDPRSRTHHPGVRRPHHAGPHDATHWPASDSRPSCSARSRCSR